MVFEKWLAVFFFFEQNVTPGGGGLVNNIEFYMTTVAVPYHVT